MARGNKLPFIAWFLALGGAVVFGILGYAAISDRSISLANRIGISYYSGLSAVITGFLLLGASLFCLGSLLLTHPFKHQLRVLLFATWVGGVALYFTFFYQ